MILDTSFLIDLIKNKENAFQKAKILDNSSPPLRTTSISIFELRQGIEDINESKKKEKIEQLLNALGLLNFDLESAKIAGTIFAELERKGEIIEAEDCMIAGIAIHHNEPILTRNSKHFQRIKGLKLETY
ncbi:type II toxin-antitoxin system VapC family toxin [Candidatus Woesearchaeota archaeon]|nr:type II toxin-antitoxin system VapC family toxin [Candidatus Woesearchaeota archaeon]